MGFKSPKNKVFEVSCLETDMSKIIAASSDQIGDLIEGELDNNEGAQLTFTIKTKYLTTAYLNKLPEWEG